MVLPYVVVMNYSTVAGSVASGRLLELLIAALLEMSLNLAAA